MNDKQRINEFLKLQVYYDEGFTIRLTHKKEKLFYTTFVWIGNSIKPIIVDSGRYFTAEDPLELIAISRRIIGKQKAGQVKLTTEMVKGKAEKGIKKK